MKFRGPKALRDSEQIDCKGASGMKRTFRQTENDNALIPETDLATKYPGRPMNDHKC